MNEENNEEYIRPCRIDLLDDWDGGDVWKRCVLGMTVDYNDEGKGEGGYVSVLSEGNDDEEGRRNKREWMKRRAAEELLLVLDNEDENEWGRRDLLELVDTLEEIEDGRKFDTVIVNGLPLTSSGSNNDNDVLEGVDLTLEEWKETYMKKGGMMYVFGEGPVINKDKGWYENGPAEQVFSEIVDLFDSVQSVSCWIVIIAMM